MGKTCPVQPTDLGSSASLAIDQLCDLDLEQKSHSIFYFAWQLGELGEVISTCMKWLTQDGYSINSRNFYNLDLPVPSLVLFAQAHLMNHSNKPKCVKG